MADTATRRALPALLGIAALVLLVGGGWLTLQERGAAASADPDSSGSAVPAAGRTTGTTAPEGDALPEATPAERRPGAPRRLIVPALGVDAPVVPVKAPGRTLVPPSDPTELGWWADGARPGDRRGSALVAGHTVHTGGGALDDLEDLTSGDRITVRTDHGPIRYVVRSVRVFPKGTISRRAEQLFSQDVPGRLVVLTCEDWDGERYLSNVVVVARPR